MQKGFSSAAYSRLAKISAPPSLKTLPRTRLFRLLDRSTPITWICAAPGAGKTTLVSSYLQTRGLAHLWYRVDMRDADARFFFEYMGKAAKQGGGRQKPLPSFTSENAGSLPAFTRRFFESLYLRFKNCFVIVFDNYHEAPLHDILNHALSVLPVHGRAIIISRGEPPTTLVRLRAERIVNLIDGDDLQFTRSEAYGFARTKTSRPDRGYVSALHTRTQGWPAAIALLLERTTTRNKEVLDDGLPQVVLDYFSSEVFQTFDPTTQNLLMQLTCLPAMTTPGAVQLTGQPGVEAVIQDLAQRKYFIRRDETESTYRFYPLFREFLLAQAKRHYSSPEWNRIQNRAAQVLHAEGRLDDAVSLLQKTEAWETLATWIIDNAHTYQTQGRGQTVLAWIKMLPESLVDRSPWLLYWLGTYLFFQDPSASREHLQRALTLFREEDNKTGMLHAWCGVVRAIIWEGHDYRFLNSAFSQIEPLLTDPLPHVDNDTEAYIVANIIRTISWSRIEHVPIAGWLEKAHRVLESAVNTRLSTTSALYLGSALTYYHMWVGDFNEATETIQMLADIKRSREFSKLDEFIYNTTELSYLCVVGNDARRGIELIYESLASERAIGVSHFDSIYLCLGLTAALSDGNCAITDEFYSLLKDLKPEYRLQATCYHHAAFQYARARNADRGMTEHARLQISTSEQLGAPLFSAMAHLNIAHVLHRQHDDGAAHRHLEQAHKIAETGNSDLIRHATWLAEAEFALDRENYSTMVERLEKAFTVARRQGIMNFPGWHQPTMSRLCAQALKAEIEVEFVHRLIQHRELVPPSDDLENWPRRFKLYSFGELRLVREGATVALQEKIGNKPIELLKAIVALGGRGVPEQRLCEALWPDADGDNAHKAFAINLHRLRKLFGLEAAIQLKDKRVTLDPHYCWLDIWAFEQLLCEAGPEHRHLTPNDITTLERGLTLYQGAFLAQDMESWLLAPRERLRSKFLRHARRLGEHWEQQQEWQRGIDWYQRALEIDNLAEEFYCRLMYCYRQSGRLSEALDTYRRCRETLRQLLNVEPTEKTTSFYHALREGETSLRRSA